MASWELGLIEVHADSWGSFALLTLGLGCGKLNRGLVGYIDSRPCMVFMVGTHVRTPIGELGLIDSHYIEGTDRV